MPQLATRGPFFAAKLFFDINTAPENNAISRKRMPSLLKEFIDYVGRETQNLTRGVQE